MTRRRIVLAGLAMLPLTLGPILSRAEANGAAGPVAALYQGLEAVRQAGRDTPFPQRVATLTPVVDRAFSLEDVLRASIGPRYASLPADQKTELLQVFADYTVASYVANFAGSSADRFVVDPQTRPLGADQVVSSQILPAAGKPTRLDYVVRRGANGWQIVDVLIDGSISQVAVQRSDFRSLLSGDSAERLIASLRGKTATLAAGGKT